MLTTNVSLRLTDNEEVLDELRQRKAFRKVNGVETYTVQFDSQAFEFTPGKVITVPADAARCMAASRTLIGGSPVKAKYRNGEEYTYRSSLDAEWTPILEVVEKWAAGEQAPSAIAAAPSTCGTCGKDQGTVEALIAHLATHLPKTDTEFGRKPQHAGAGK